MQLIHFDCVNGFLNSIKEIIWQTEAIYRCPLVEVVHLILKVENVTNDPCSGFCRSGSHIIPFSMKNKSIMVLLKKKTKCFSKIHAL